MVTVSGATYQSMPQVRRTCCASTFARRAARCRSRMAWPRSPIASRPCPVEVEHRGIGIEHERRGRGVNLCIARSLVVRDRQPAQLLHHDGLCAFLR